MIFSELKANEIIKKYVTHYFNSINKNKKLLIEAFTIYYGKQYKDLITNRINNTNFYLFISDITIQIIYDGIITNSITDKSLLNDLMLVLKGYKNKTNLIKIFSNNTKLDKFYKKQIIEALSSDLQIYGFHIFTFDDNNNPVQNVFTSIFSDDKNLIHELNHVITSSALALVYNDDEFPATIVKNGIATSYASDHHKVGNGLEEVINDKIAFEITKIFHYIGGNITSYKIDYPNTTYSELFPIIDKFYNKYKDLLIRARITDNTNLLFKEIDKKKFIEFQKMIDECLEIVASNKKVPIWVADQIITEMDLNNNDEILLNQMSEYLHNKHEDKTGKGKRI